MNKEDIIREVESMLDVGGYQVAKSIVKLAALPPGTIREIGKKGRKKPMTQAAAKAMVDKAEIRIELADAPD